MPDAPPWLAIPAPAAVRGHPPGHVTSPLPFEETTAQSRNLYLAGDQPWLTSTQASFEYRSKSHAHDQGANDEEEEDRDDDDDEDMEVRSSNPSRASSSALGQYPPNPQSNSIPSISIPKSKSKSKSTSKSKSSTSRRAFSKDERKERNRVSAKLSRNRFKTEFTNLQHRVALLEDENRRLAKLTGADACEPMHRVETPPTEALNLGDDSGHDWKGKEPEPSAGYEGSHQLPLLKLSRPQQPNHRQSDDAELQRQLVTAQSQRDAAMTLAKDLQSLLDSAQSELLSMSEELQAATAAKDSALDAWNAALAARNKALKDAESVGWSMDRTQEALDTALKEKEQALEALNDTLLNSVDPSMRAGCRTQTFRAQQTISTRKGPESLLRALSLPQPQP